jgi:hypothetical protein
MDAGALHSLARPLLIQTPTKTPERVFVLSRPPKMVSPGRFCSGRGCRL